MQDVIQSGMTLYEKLHILSDAAKYDVACTSSGVDRQGDGTGMGNCRKAGYATVFQRTGGVYPSLRFCLQTSAYLTVNTVLTGHPTTW